MNAPDCFGQSISCMKPGCPCCDPETPDEARLAWAKKHALSHYRDLLVARIAARAAPEPSQSGKEPAKP